MDSSNGRKNPRLTAPKGACDTHTHFYNATFPSAPTALMTPPDAWVDESKTKVGYEIPLNRHFYRFEPPRELAEIEADIKVLEGEILDLLREVTA